MRTIAIFAFGFALACGNSSSGNDAGSDGAVEEVNNCAAYTDDTAGAAAITGPTGASPAQYTPNCIHVKVGQSVTFNSDFTDHPLEPSGGDSPNPIPETESGTTVSVTFANAGTFGFKCQAHPSIMFGAVQVTQ